MEPNTRLKPVNEFRIYKRNLPHWEYPGSVYFITFRTAEGFTLSDAEKEITFTSIKFHANKKFRLYACVVMGTHAHLILQPLEESGSDFYGLAQIMHSVKSYSANRIQRLLHIKGKVWLNENYDRIVRDDNEYFETMDYVIYNPVRAGLVEKPEDYRWLFFEGID